MPANETSSTIRTDEVLATSGVNKSKKFLSGLDAPFELERLIRPLVSESRSDGMRIRSSFPVYTETDTLHSLQIRTPNFFQFLAENGLGVHLSQHQRKVVVGVADVFHECPDSAGQTVAGQSFTHLRAREVSKTNLHPLPIFVSDTRPTSES
jgi:hypothetical protein